MYEFILKHLIDLIDDASKGSILIYNPKENYMEFKACIGFDFEKLKNVKLKVEELFLYKENKLKEASIIRNPEKYDRLNISSEKYTSLKK